MARPLIISDCDEVLLHMIVPFGQWLDETQPVSFKLIGNDSSYTRLQAPFQPIYVAGYVMDKFAFDDIIFNVGVRVDRYDANQNVLKDPYLWRPAYKAGDGQVQQHDMETAEEQQRRMPGRFGRFVGRARSARLAHRHGARRLPAAMWQRRL